MSDLKWQSVEQLTYYGLDKMSVKADITYCRDEDKYSLKLWYRRRSGGFFVLREQEDLPDIIEIIKEYTKDLDFDILYLDICVSRKNEVTKILVSREMILDSDVCDYLVEKVDGMRMQGGD